ncbi:restriction endonuclease subunit S domain-containing protein [Mycobacteroides abscessus]|uniref:hypothetical protein n=1 Tax=Mycobacteroides abscessus TaxID=36809 RepID=UPI00104260C1|nr:hypothetical protein [Mycobacteroides abscessus]
MGKPGPALLGLGSIIPGGGFRNDYKTYGGDCPSELMLVPGDLYVSLKGATKDGDMIGSVARVPSSVPSGRLTQDTVKLNFRERDAVFEQYLYWLLRTPNYRDYCAGRATGSAVVALSREDFLSYPVPPLTAPRRRVVDTLETIEDKIESNRHVIRRASYLIDALAHQTMDKNTTQSVALSELVAFNRETVRPSLPDDQLLYIDIASVSPGSINGISRMTWSAAPSRARRGVADGDVIYSTVRPGRRSFAQILEPEELAVASTGFAVMTPTPAIGSSLLTTIAGSLEFAAYLESVAHGSAYPAVSVEAMGNYQVEIPTDDAVVAEFESATMPLRRRAHQAARESTTLTKLRDGLLPQLLSGHIHAPEANSAVAEVVA